MFTLEFLDRPWTLISIWIAVIPSGVPGYLEVHVSGGSLPMPWISDRIAYLLPSILSTPRLDLSLFWYRLLDWNTGIRARQELQVDAIEDDPFEDRTSDTTLIAYGNSSLGITEEALQRVLQTDLFCSGLRGGFWLTCRVTWEVILMHVSLGSSIDINAI